MACCLAQPDWHGWKHVRNLKQFLIYLHLLIQLFKVWEPSTDLVTFVTQAYEGKSSMILTSYCPLSTFRCGSCTCFSLLLAAAHLWSSGSLALGKFLKRTSHLFCTLCTSSGSCLSLTLPRESLKPGPYQYESTRLCLKAVAPSNTDEQWPSVTSAVTNACCS